MAIVTTPVGVLNLALDRLGQREISSITSPTTEVETICARHWDRTRLKVFRKYVFNFSRKLATLTASTTKFPAFGFISAYAVPNDFVRLLSLGDSSVVNADIQSELYELSEGYIYTDSADETYDPALAYAAAYAAAQVVYAAGGTAAAATIAYDAAYAAYITANTANGLKIAYVYDASDIISKWDPLFVDVLVLQLAADMAYKFALKNSLIGAIRTELQDAELSAAAVAGQEKPPRRIQRSKFRSARNGGIRRGDNTHYA